MQVKLDIQGELAEYIKEKAKKEFRSGKQQVLYMLNDYYNREMELKNNYLFSIRLFNSLFSFFTLIYFINITTTTITINIST